MPPALYFSHPACVGHDTLHPLAASVSATTEALAGDEPPESVAPDFQTSRAASYVSHHWEL